VYAHIGGLSINNSQIYGYLLSILTLSANRDWEDDVEVRESGCNPDEVDDIAEQLVFGEIAPKLKVIFGCGRREFLDSKIDEGGKRNDGKNLIEDWKKDKKTPVYVEDKKGLLELDPKANSHYLGLFDYSHCTYNLEVQEKQLQDEKPSLTEMMEKAIEILSQNENGYFLFVEGGRIE
jgi:alkaline phosphatase